jgi:hypothetical protein
VTRRPAVLLPEKLIEPWWARAFPPAPGC